MTLLFDYKPGICRQTQNPITLNPQTPTSSPAPQTAPSSCQIPDEYISPCIEAAKSRSLVKSNALRAYQRMLAEFFRPLSIDPVSIEYSAFNNKYVGVIFLKDLTIQGVSVAKGTKVGFYEGKLSTATLASDQTIKWRTFAKGTEIQLDGKGNPVEGILASDQLVGGVLAVANTKFRFVWDTLSLTPIFDQNIQGVPVAGKKEISFYKGKLSAATLTADFRTEGIVAAKGTQIYFSDGKVVAAILASDQIIQGVPAAAGHEVRFDKGKLVAATLAVDFPIQGMVAARGTQIQLSRGKVVAATLAVDQIIQGVPAAAGHDIRFYKGQLNKATLASDYAIPSTPQKTIINLEKLRNAKFGLNYTLQERRIMSLPRGTTIDIDSEMDYSRVILGQDWMFRGVLMSAETTLRFDKDTWSVEFPSGQITQLQGMTVSNSVSFYEDGNIIDGVTLAGDQWIQGIHVSEEDPMYFHKNGILHAATLANDQIIDHKVICAGVRVYFSEKNSALVGTYPE